eukprot:m.26804 g.26804  ORF g.26804 m.26804 type:complete len:140 (+) comp11573_c0_seq1:66-485(+)
MEDDNMIRGKFPGASSLLDEMDKKLLCILRDGRKLIGYLRTIDQFANLVLQDTIERIYVGKTYGDIERGIYIVRGENVVLLGEVDPSREENMQLTRVSVDEILLAQQMEQQQREQQLKHRNKLLLERGYQPEARGEELF